MPDNIELTGGGPKLATDNLGDAHMLRAKLDAGEDGQSHPIVAGQQLAEDSLPTVLASDHPNVPVFLGEMIAALKLIINLLARPPTVEPGTGRTRVSLETSTPTLATTISSGTLTTVSSLTQIAGFDAKLTLLNHAKRTAWALGIRNRIT